MKSISLGIIANTGKPAVTEVLPPFLSWLKSKNISFVVADDLQQIIDISDYASVDLKSVAADVDFVLSFGGDGTFLRTAYIIQPFKVPIIGVNLGAFGYLAEVKIDQLNKRINDLLNDRYVIQKRIMLEATSGADKQAKVLFGLNDIIIEKGDFPRTIRLETSIDDEYLNTFNADGLIVSTPTGSTGYSLSVGGPILEPELNAMIISPINPHMLANRPLVVSDKRVVSIITLSEAGDFQVIADGQRVIKLKSGDSISIKRASFYTNLVLFGDSTFYKLLRNKLQWRDQLFDIDDSIGETQKR
ncbi:MAG: NAD(+)/NADH kinase [Candidatus Hatepunaea meridiana]|nr:NAD(+)/NADH kinase [Candidatus Hatepunaea meridiana]